MRGQSSGAEVALVHVEFGDEEGVSATGAVGVSASVAWVAAAGELVVCGVHEGLALVLVLADEDDVGGRLVAAGLGAAADPTSSLSPGVAPTQHPKAGRRPVALKREPRQRNTRTQQVPPRLATPRRTSPRARSRTCRRPAFDSEEVGDRAGLAEVDQRRVDPALERRLVLDQAKAKPRQLALPAHPRVGQPDRRTRSRWG
jgi:hypothetical protein